MTGQALSAGSRILWGAAREGAESTKNCKAAGDGTGNIGLRRQLLDKNVREAPARPLPGHGPEPKTAPKMGYSVQLAADFPSWPLGRVDIRIGSPVADGRHDFRHRTRLDTVTSRSNHQLRRDHAREFGRSFGAGLRPGGPVSEVGTQEEADAAVHAELAEMHVRLRDRT